MLYYNKFFVIFINVTGHEKIGLMCTENLTTFLEFNRSLQINILNSKGDMRHNMKRCILCT